MKVPSRTKYAILALIELARASNGQTIKIGEIAKKQEIPQRFLEVILSQLKHAGFVESRRGADGGYQLARPASRITVSEVLELFGAKGGKSSSNTELNAHILLPSWLVLGRLWDQVDKAIEDILSNTSIEKLSAEEEHLRAGAAPMYMI